MQPTSIKQLPIDIDDFKLMIEGNYLYVDKTQQIYNLFKEGGRYFFLSRPRRFGKTLLISTLKELFAGNKKLFNNLWIDKESNWRWENHPVIHMDFSAIGHTTDQDLEKNLIWTLEKIAQSYEIDLSHPPTLSAKMVWLVEQLAKKIR